MVFGFRSFLVLVTTTNDQITIANLFKNSEKQKAYTRSLAPRCGYNRRDGVCLCPCLFRRNLHGTLRP